MNVSLMFVFSDNFLFEIVIGNHALRVRPTD